MTGRNAKGLCAAGVVVGVMLQALVVLDARAPGSQRPRGELVIFAEQEMRDVQIELRVIEANDNRQIRNHPSDMDELRVGDLVQVCFRVSQPGYVTLFSQDGDQPPSQIYPNQFEGGDGQVDDTEQCLGRRGAGWGIRVEGPPGDSLLFMHYAREKANQISESDFPVIRRARARSFGAYASSTVGFHIVP